MVKRQEFMEFGDVEVDLRDKAFPVAIAADGFMSLEEAVKLYSDLGMAIAKVRQLWPAVRIPEPKEAGKEG